MNLSKNEIITLEHLSDGQDHDDAPKGLTDAQFYTALKSLQAKQMVRAAFITGGEVCSSHILNPGQAALDDMESTKKRILRKLLSDRNLSVDQYTLIKYTQEHEISSSSEMFAQEHFGVDRDYYKKNIWEPLIREDYLDVNEERTGMIITRKGIQLLEEVDEELYEILAEGGNPASVNTSNHQTESTNMQNESALATLLQEKENKIRELEERLKEYETPIAIEPHIRVQLVGLYKILEAAGADLKSHGAKTKGAKVAEYLTGIVFTTCKTIMSDRNVSKEAHSEEINKFNKFIKDIGLTCEI